MPRIPLFNSIETEWRDMKVSITGAPLIKIRGLKYGVKSETEALHAAGDEPISLQTGNRTYDGSFKVLKGALDDMNRAAVIAGGRDITDLSFDIIVNYIAKGNRAIQVDTLVSVKVTGFEKGWDQGAKQMEVELPIMFLGLKSL